MIIKGKYNEAKVLTDNIDEATIKQIEDLLNQPLSKGSTIRIMPDTHAGAGGVIGLTMTLTDKVAPQLVGSDIGCGVMLTPFSIDKEIDLEKLDNFIKENIPHGRSVREDPLYLYWVNQDKYIYKSDNFGKIFHAGLGTLGGGNHFIELYKGDDNIRFIAVHTGSRGVGGAIYKHYKALAKSNISEKYRAEKLEIVNRLKSENRHNEIATELEKHKNEYLADLSSPEIPYLEGEDMQNYLWDSELANEYARRNRSEITDLILNHLNAIPIATIDRPHNFIDRKTMILRKGAQESFLDEYVVIPINMRDGTILAFSNEDADWNFSAPHGAGRVLTRTTAKKTLNVDDFKEQMKDVYSSTVGIDTLDESPDAYKSLDSILGDVKDRLRNIRVLKPIYNFKGGQE